MSEKGGADWEQGQAVTRMVTAMRSNDPEAMAIALGDYAAALGTRVTASLGAIAAPLLEEIRGMRIDRATDARIAEHKLDLIMHMTERSQMLLGQFEARLSIIETNTLANVISQTDREQLVEWARSIPDLARRIARLEADRHANR